jgi:ubiquitin-protein ligase
MSSSSGAARRLALEFRKMSDAPVSGIVARPRDPANLLVWEFTIAGPEGSVYESGVFTGTLVFPTDYPLAPPKMVFETRITHPNVYGPGARAGEVCISILHTGHDFTGYERAEERWSSAQSVQSILLVRARNRFCWGALGCDPSAEPSRDIERG